MPSDRRPSSSSSRSPRPARPAPGKTSRSGSAPRKSSSASRSSSAGSDRPAPRRYDDDGNRSAPARRDSSRGSSTRGNSSRRDPRATPVEDGERPSRGHAAAHPRPERRTDGRPGGRAGGRSTGRPTGRDRVAPRRVEKPKTAAQLRSAEVKAARGVREPRQPVEPPPWERELWVDDGPIRSAARGAAARAKQHDVAEP